jgi:MFS family permease
VTTQLTDSTDTASAWAPMRNRVFRALWIAVLVSNIGTYLQTVGAQLLLVNAAHAAVLVALVTTADMLPDALFGLAGGVLADIFDRRRLLIIVQLGMGALAAVLASLAYLGRLSPALVLTFTFLLGCSSVLSNPAYQSLAPELTSDGQAGAAATLGAVSLNLARVIGPALAGFLVAWLGVPFVFALNAATYVFFGLVVAAWRPKVRPVRELPEHFWSALRAGGRYLLNARVPKRMLLRTAVFVFPASVLWALLPLVATQRLRLGAAGYGLLLGAVGIGAILGALSLSRLEHRLSDSALIAGSGIVFALAMALLVVLPAAAFAVLLPAGAAWIIVLSIVNARLEMVLPAWIRARGLSMYQMLLFGGQAVGAVVWGAIGETIGIVPAFLIAAGVLLVGIASFRWWPFLDLSQIDPHTSPIWPEPELAITPDPQRGPVVVETVYSIPASRETAFLELMTRVRRSRLRTGATRWQLFRKGERSHSFIEMYSMPSWEEHLRQHRVRITTRDAALDRDVKALSDSAIQTWHLIEVDSD